MPAGTLFIIATPIGNLSDVTLRALETLRMVDAVFAEDTRVSRKLLDRYDIKKPLLSYREAAPQASVQRTLRDIMARLDRGEQLAFVSDAGTPGVSDPGGYLVETIVAAGYAAVPIPGPSALSTLVSISGLPIYRPLFVGFLPKKKGHRTLMTKIRQSMCDELIDAVILYESPERVVKLLQELLEWEIPLRACIGRELTKMHEELLRGTVQELYNEVSERSQLRGEFSLIIAPDPQ